MCNVKLQEALQQKHFANARPWKPKMLSQLTEKKFLLPHIILDNNHSFICIPETQYQILM